MLWRSALPFSSGGLAPGHGSGSASSRAARSSTRLRTPSGVPASRTGLFGAEAQAAKSGKVSSTPTA
ncbi:hypothetical protein SANT12839_053890 [Streptomyces antimycoticus]|uniref:Uncharacterized protein n=1 Tax=Streptomyces antimycoticus TaxID=68175 RepID=A0A4D4KDU6_9ACTN|nr:hypothetical protein SANT12839_053890 [Streptomyces antimycoticus]